MGDSSYKEFLLIVVGVLLAFGIESLWSDYREGREDRGYLETLRNELQADRGRIALAFDRAVGAQAAIDTLRQSGDGLAEDRIPGLLWRATSVAQMDVTSTALESLFRSPAWARLDDAELAMLLTALDESLDRLARASLRVSNYWFDGFEPRLRTLVDFEEWSVVGNPSRSDEREEGMTLGSDWSAVLEDQQITNLLTHTYWFAGEVERLATPILGQMDDITTRLQ